MKERTVGFAAAGVIPDTAEVIEIPVIADPAGDDVDARLPASVALAPVATPTTDGVADREPSINVNGLVGIDGTVEVELEVEAASVAEAEAKEILNLMKCTSGESSTTNKM